MSEFGGYDFDTLEELKSIAKMRVDKLRAGNEQQQMAANSQQVIDAIFGSPEIRKAKRTEEAIMEARNSVERKEGQSEEDYQIAQEEAVRDALAKIDPSVSVQANQRILALNQAKLQRVALEQGNRAQQLDIERTEREAKASATPVIFREDKDGQRTAVERLDPKLTPAERDAVLRKYQEADEENDYILGSGLDELKIEDDATNPYKLNASTIGERQDSISDSSRFMGSASALFEHLLEDPLALAVGGEVAADAAGLLTAVKRFAGELLPWQQDQDIVEIEEGFRKGDFENAISGMGIASSVARGLALNMAHRLAKALDPGGRLSDQDVTMAIQMLTGKGNPDDLIKLMRARMDEINEGTDLLESDIDSGALGPIGQGRWEKYQAKRERAYALLDEYTELAKKGGLLTTYRSKFGKAGLLEDWTEEEEKNPETAEKEREVQGSLQTLNPNLTLDAIRAEYNKRP